MKYYITLTPEIRTNLLDFFKKRDIGYSELLEDCYKYFIYPSRGNSALSRGYHLENYIDQIEKSHTEITVWEEFEIILEGKDIPANQYPSIFN